MDEKEYNQYLSYKMTPKDRLRMTSRIEFTKDYEENAKDLIIKTFKELKEPIKERKKVNNKVTEIVKKIIWKFF